MRQQDSDSLKDASCSVERNAVEMRSMFTGCADQIQQGPEGKATPQNRHLSLLSMCAYGED